MRINYADGRKVRDVTLAEARALLGRECAVIEECGDRWLAWATLADADGPDGNGDAGARAVAEILAD